MKKWSNYRIPFVGLKNGLHHFNFVIESDYFEGIEDSQVSKAKIFADLAFEKKERLFVLDFDISGTVNTTCDRCAEALDLPIHGHFRVFIRTGSPVEGDDVDVLYISPEETHLELGQLLYEFIHLSLPIQRNCSEIIKGEKPCNEEALKYLQHAKKQADDKKTDPRWEKLKQLKNK